MTYYLGADPGSAGGLAILDGEGSIFATWRWAKCSLLGLSADLRAITAEHRVVGHLERVGAWPGQGRSSAFTFGHNAGQMEALLRLSGVAYTLETPANWQRRMRCDKKSLGSDTGPAHKRALLEEARRRWPGHAMHADVADALLLAEDCRMLRGARA